MSGTRSDSDPSDAVPGPPAAVLSALGSDAWASLLGAARRVLATRHDEVLAPLRDAPTSRLVAGPLRDALAQALADDPSFWRETVAALPARADLPDALVGVLNDEWSDASDPGAGEASASGTSLADDRATDERERTRRRAQAAYQERDRWRRRAEGAEARIERLEVARADAERDLSLAEAEVVRLREHVRRSADEQRRAVEREGRRREAQIERLEETVRALRRAEEDRRAEDKRRLEASRALHEEEERARRDAERSSRDDAAPRVIPGRPSALPDGIEPGTTEAAAALLHRGRLVLIDGYNVTKQHRAHLDLEGQRSWLVQLAGTMASQRGIRAVVVFDGQFGGGRTAAGNREVQVRFTMAGITADDDIVFTVAATDEPVVVVTDDRDLIDRVQASGADAVATRSLLGLV